MRLRAHFRRASWLFALVLSCAAGQLPATLVVVIPTGDGPVIAADSRLSFGKKHADGVEKIHFIPGRPELAFALTGQSEFLPVVDMDASPADLLESARRGPRLYSGESVVRSFLSASYEGAITVKVLTNLGAKLTDSLAVALRSRVNGQPYSGRPLFRAIAVRYDADARRTDIGSVCVELTPSGQPRVSDVVLNSFSPESSRTAMIYGEQRYFDEHVWKGSGRRFLNLSGLHLWNAKLTTGEFNAGDAHFITRDWIEATAKTAELVPAPSGVGGATRTYWMDGRQPARELFSR